jgi:mRNA interferase YafQ
MRTTEWTSAFKRDYKLALATPRHKDLAMLLTDIAGLLSDDKQLPAKHRDHGLSGNWKGIGNAI